MSAVSVKKVDQPATFAFTAAMRLLMVAAALVLMTTSAHACRQPMLTSSEAVYQAKMNAKVIETLQEQKRQLRGMEVKSPALMKAFDEEIAARALDAKQTALLSHYRSDEAQFNALTGNIRPVCAEEKSRLSSCVEQLCSDMTPKALRRATILEDGLRYFHSKKERDAFVVEQQKIQNKWK